jgi:alpha-mannosidase
VSRAELLGIGVGADDRGDIDEMWQDTMLAQFHDCLPGTTIKTVVLDNLEIYSKRGAQAQSLIDIALESLVDASDSSAQTVIDPLRLVRSERYDTSSWLTTDSTGFGTITPSLPPLDSPKTHLSGEVWTVSNSRFSLSISKGRITSVYDTILLRELIAPGPGCDDAGLMIYEDLPLNYDAWDAEIYHLKCGSAIYFDKVGNKVDEELRATLVAEAKFGESQAIVEISLDAIEKGKEMDSQPIIRVKVVVDWHEKHKFLKCKSASFHETKEETLRN